ncbi:DUF1761 domain-containing protein [Actinomycetes bacterium KLBMP 9759]
MSITVARPAARTPLAVGVATVVAFVLSSTYYAVFAEQYAALLGTPAAAGAPPVGQILLELCRSAVLGSVLALAASRTGTTTARGALGMALVAFVGFPAVLLSGSVLWDGVAVPLAVLHGGDWLIKLVVLSLVVVTVRNRPSRRGAAARS